MAADHTPDNPFGCVTTWGPHVNLGPGGGLHLCNRDDGHKGRCQCKCGSTPADAGDR